MKFACMLKVFCLSLILAFTILIGTQFNNATGDIMHNCNETEISHVDPNMFKRGIEIYTQLLQNYSNSEFVRDDFEPENRICYLLEGMHRACEEVVTENCDASLVSNKCGEREPDALKDVNRSVQKDEQKTNMKLEAVLARIQNILNTTQPEEGDHRCGNPAFITFVTKITKLNNNDLLMSGEEEKKYLYNSFGNISRIDYGTGHELNFLCYLYVLCEKKLLSIAEVFKTLDLYFDLVREIIVKYKSEPAGSHGAWGIDDYQILPFLLGSSELCNSQLTFDDLLNQECKYVYAKAICFVNRQKTKYRMVPFKTHSPMIYGISQKKWAFVNFELMDRYRMDVLNSKAVNQHFIYSSFLLNEQCNNINQFEK